MRTYRQTQLDRALAETLRGLGEYLLPDKTLRQEIILRTHPRATETEAEATIAHFDAEKRLTSVQAEAGPKWKLNDNGKAWAAENL
jgi:hypothetical protein